MYNISLTGILALIWLGMFYALSTTLGWHYHHDTPLLNFAATMMVHEGWWPYRDIFETTMPLTFAFHWAVVALGLEGNGSFIALGLVWFAALALIGAALLWPLSRAAALLFVPVYLVFMISFGPEALLQREVLGLLPVSLAVLVAARMKEGRAPLLRLALIGALFGAATLIKPQFALGAPVAVLMALFVARARAGQGIACALAGFALPLALGAAALWRAGALEALIFILRDYTPLYVQQTRTHEFIAPEARGAYLRAHWYRFGGLWPLAAGPVALAVGAAALRREMPRRMRGVMAGILALSVIYGLVPILSGQFWPYHYFLFAYFALLAVAALSAALARAGSMRWGALAVAFLVLGLLAPRMADLDRLARSSANRLAEAQEMAGAMALWLESGARVQPLDWTSGALHAMMLARMHLATRFMYDFHFAHHVSDPVIQGLRAQLMAELEADPPEALLVGLKATRVHGRDVSYDFPALDAFRAAHYAPVAQSARFELWRRRDLGE